MGNVTVTAPFFLSLSEINNWIQPKKKWIFKNINRLNGIDQNNIEISNFTRNEAKAKIIEYVKESSIITQTTINKIYISSAKTRWGTCSSKGNVRINWKLINAPDEILQYVIFHELCHLKHPNHSRQFWAEVSKYDPQYKIHRKWLKENGHKLQKAG